ncbi:MAG: VCBS repeat-containing protein, partial [Flavobacteriales bacterium]|nr:VCBS repeat-containing protein [Flavobacteriales bacterium]
LEYFPGFSMIDIDLDGRLDLIASPAIKGSQNVESVWRYKNTSTNNVPNFVRDSKSFLQDEMIDVGEGANPHLYDIDGDGLLDLLIGNYGYYKVGGGYKSNISFYKNTGTSSTPKFEFIEENFGDFEQYDKWINIYPAFGDLNDDGIADVIIGENTGFIHYFIGREINKFDIKYFEYLDVDVGNGAMPNLVDVDEDGLLDLIIGNKKGNLHFYKNIGTKQEPNFELISKKWGNIDLSHLSTQGGWLSSDIIIHPKLGKLLILGTQTGVTFAYKNITTVAEETFELVSKNYFNHDEGERTTIAVGDINGDSYPDFVIGNMSGGLRLALDATHVINHKNKLVIYPNPVVNDNYIYLKYKTNLRELTLDVFDTSGRKMSVKILANKIDISALNRGIYILREKIEGKFVSSKFIVL